MATTRPNAPLIGIVPRVEERKNGHGNAVYAQQELVDGLHAAGGAAIVLTRTADEACLRRYVQMCDGFLFPGGYDVDPARYGEEPIGDEVLTEPAADGFDFALLPLVIASGKPVLTICRGTQVLNVALGGTLWQDVPSQVQAALPEGARVRHMDPQPIGVASHEVSIVAGSLLDRTMAAEGRRAWVSSTHHQAIRDVAPGFAVTARADDGIVEAIEPAADGPYAGRFILSVQWHPEVTWCSHPEHLRLFEGLVAAARG